MKLSNNTIVVNDFPNKGDALLYSTRSQALVKIDEELKNIIQNFDKSDPTQRNKYEDDLKTLHNMSLIVENEDEDFQRLKSFLDQLKYGVLQSCFSVTILTTYACNFKCTYCFEESSRANVKMDLETCDHVLNFLKAKLIKFGYRELYITFYGGEPLLNRPGLEYIATHMKEWCEQRGISFKFLLQTNGFFLTPELVDQYLKLGMSSVRISVDGVDNDHDRFRPLRGGGKTFETVVRNIVACCDKVKIGISTGYDKGDTTAIEKLLDHFENLGVLHKLGRFIFAPIHPTLGPKGNPELIQNSHCMCNYEDKSLVEANRRIHELMEKKGLPMKSGMSTSICAVTRNESGVTIDQHGRIYKCNSMLGHPELATGDVRDNDYNERHREFVNLDVWRQCPQDCTYLPMCSGGCRLSAFLKNQNFKVPACHKNYLNQMAPEYIKEDYMATVGKKS